MIVYDKLEKEIKEQDNPPPISLPPTLAALSIVLKGKEDLGNISRSHPDLRRHIFFNRKVTFPEDISDRLPSEDRWWEELGKS
jgi:hypothetical protein